MEENKTSGRKKFGIALIVLPILLWLFFALKNGFSFGHPWLGNGSTDLLWGIIGLVLVVVGIILVATSADQK